MTASQERIAELLREIAIALGEISAMLEDLIALECEKLLGPVPKREKLRRYPICEDYVAGIEE